MLRHAGGGQSKVGIPLVQLQLPSQLSPAPAKDRAAIGGGRGEKQMDGATGFPSALHACGVISAAYQVASEQPGSVSPRCSAHPPHPPSDTTVVTMRGPVTVKI